MKKELQKYKENKNGGKIDVFLHDKITPFYSFCKIEGKKFTSYPGIFFAKTSFDEISLFSRAFFAKTKIVCLGKVCRKSLF
jgi:hypothetical protein